MGCQNVQRCLESATRNRKAREGLRDGEKLQVRAERDHPEMVWRQPAAPQANIETDFVTPHYLRFVIVDRPGILASIAGVFWRHGLNVDAVLQEPGWPKAALPFVVTLERCSARKVQAALADIEAFDFHARRPVWMPILPRGERCS